MINELIFRQLEFAREQTLKAVQDLSDDEVRVVPEGFRNHILWNLGHIALSHERFAFHFSGLPLHIPEDYVKLFAMGTSPLDWTSEGPSLEEVLTILREQPERIRTALSERLQEQVTPYTTSAGFTMETIGQFLNFSSYHEALHFSVIKLYKRLI